MKADKEEASWSQELGKLGLECMFSGEVARLGGASGSWQT
jgi:hypothetical protein